jgi:hypothetical protein
MWQSESVDFVNWLNNHGKPAIHIHQINSVTNILSRISTPDLIQVLYNAEDEFAIKALKELKERFSSELFYLDQLNSHQERSNENPWD